MNKVQSKEYLQFAKNTLLKSIEVENYKIMNSKIDFLSKKFGMDPVTKFDLNLERI